MNASEQTPPSSPPPPPPSSSSQTASLSPTPMPPPPPSSFAIVAVSPTPMPSPPHSSSEIVAVSPKAMPPSPPSSSGVISVSTKPPLSSQPHKNSQDNNDDGERNNKNSSSNNNTSSSPSTALSKIPIRPNKIRKISSSSSSAMCVRTPPLSRIPSRPLSAEGEVSAALRHLRAADPALIPLIDTYDPPTCQTLHPPFHSLARSILYQQLAFKAASSVYSRFISLCGGESCVLPEVILQLTPSQLRQIGVSERKAGYLYDLAHKYQSGILSDSSIVAMDDKSLFTMLTMVKGIGAWSVHMFMIFSLHRPDVLPVGDLGVRKGVQFLYRLEELPKPSQMEQLCEKWRPYRSIGAWYMWRLVENKGPPTMASAGIVGLPLLMPPPTPQIPLTQLQNQQQQQQQSHQSQPPVIQSIQGLPNIRHIQWQVEVKIPIILFDNMLMFLKREVKEGEIKYFGVTSVMGNLLNLIQW